MSIIENVSGPPGDGALVHALRAGDERVFGMLVDRYTPTMMRVARGYVATQEAAEDAVQDTWLGVIRGIDTFEGRSTLKTWIFRILVNQAKTRGARDARTKPFSAVVEAVDTEAADVDADRFRQEGRWQGFWQAPPSKATIPDESVVLREAGGRLLTAIEALPDTQRAVISLRDVHGLSADEVCDVLEISDANQRVLLHRARARVRNELEQYLEEREGP